MTVVHIKRKELSDAEMEVAIRVIRGGGENLNEVIRCCDSETIETILNYGNRHQFNNKEYISVSDLRAAWKITLKP